MVSLILFHVDKMAFALNLEQTNRILQVPNVTSVSGRHDVIDGMFSFEGEVLEVISFRKLVNLQGYDKTVESLFDDLKVQHKAWIDALVHAVEHDEAFAKTTDPHACNLGKWIDNFTIDNKAINTTLYQLDRHHKNLHGSAIDVLEKREESKRDAHDWIESNVQSIYEQTIDYLSQMRMHAKEIANESQKLIIMQSDKKRVGLKVDDVDDIIHIDEKSIVKASGEPTNDMMQMMGVLNYQDSLISVIDSIAIEKVL